MSAPQRYLAARFAVIFLAALAFADLFVILALVGLHAVSPSEFPTGVLSPLTAVLAGSTAVTLVLGVVYALLLYPRRRNAILILSLIVLGLLGAHLYTINTPDTANCHDSSKGVQGCIMDESYYVPAAQTLLAGEKCAPYQDNCNLEHPFLSKAFIAAGIAIFGNNTFGWRIVNVLLGTFSVPVLFGICWVITKNERLSLYASFLLAFETLFFVHSAAAVIDVGAIFFGLLAFFFYFADVHWWRLNKFDLAGISLGLAALSKETAVFLFLVLVFYHLIFGEGSRRQVGVSTLWLCLWVAVVFCGGLELYDALFGAGVASSFVGQIDFIMRYGGGLLMTPSVQACILHYQSTYSCGWIDSVLKGPVTPLNWITYYSPVPYDVVNVKVTGPTGSFSYASAAYYGITNQFEVWLLYFWGGYVVYLWRKVKKGFAFEREGEARDYRLAKLALLWVLFVLVGYVFLFFYGRITYPYYFIEAVPALSIGAAYFLSRRWFPKEIAYIVLAGVFLWFFIFYPDKSFLPTQLRVLLGH